MVLLNRVQVWNKKRSGLEIGLDALPAPESLAVDSL
jgi:hypothetical protein